MYVLELEDGKYYVGSSDDPEKRFLDHVSGQGAAWTREHWPIRILKIIEGASVFEEDKVTKEYMAMYGIDNVRGGSYVLPTLPPEDKRSLKKEIWMANNLCTRCGRSSHFVKDCYAKTDACGDAIESPEVVVPPQPTPCRGQVMQHVQNWSPVVEHVGNGGVCFRCGASSHYVRDCYARWDVNGNPIEESCRRCYREGHSTDECYATTDAHGRYLR